VLIYLKLGGSLITDKDREEVTRPEVLQRLAGEIGQAVSSRPEMRLLLGHGAGSFGHTAAARHGTHRGAATAEEWAGFASVWHAAHRLNRLVVDALREQGLPAIGFSPSASAVCETGRLLALATEPIRRALDGGLLPIVHGDVAFDRTQGSAIVSTEMAFRYLAADLPPVAVLFAGREAGVYADFPQRTVLLAKVTPAEAHAAATSSADPDVTGGMADKVAHAVELARAHPAASVRIFSGEEPGSVFRALLGEPLGTLVTG
jgi:isopentenyl phosphate kinase